MKRPKPMTREEFLKSIYPKELFIDPPSTKSWIVGMSIGICVGILLAMGVCYYGNAY